MLAGVECPTNVKRVIGRYSGDRPGPTIVCVAGLHGNEPAGVVALQRVFERLESLRPPFRGEIVGLTGNLEAIRQGRRFITKDLNRQWRRDHLDAVLRAAPGETLDAEDQEQLELYRDIRESFDRARGRIIFLDLHTTSADGPPFVVLADTLRNRRFAMHFPTPVILGLEEQLGGTLPGYVCDLGHVTMGFEAGRHDDPASIDIHEATVWVALLAAGNVDANDVPAAGRYRETLAAACAGVPRILEIRHHHHVDDDDEFRMEPGFVNFQQVAEGQTVARDKSGVVRAPERCRMLLPLYQSQGNDGYFLVRRVRPFWLELSALLRRIRFDAAARWLPGVSPHPDRPNTLLVDPRIARWLMVEVFHLLGYRRQGREHGQFVFARREQSGAWGGQSVDGHDA